MQYALGIVDGAAYSIIKGLAYIITLYTITSLIIMISQTMIFRYNYKSNDVFYSPNSFYKVYLTALKI